MRMRSIAVGAVALIAATAAAVVPTVTASASASIGGSTKVISNTVSNGHFDTTSESGSATFSSANGPVWAIDSLREKWIIAPVSGLSDGANYTATLNVIKGSKFAEFADPGQAGCPGDADGSAGGGPHTGQGNVLGTIEYDIQSPTAPDLNAVPAVQAPNTSLGTV